MYSITECLIRDLKDKDILPKKDFNKYIKMHMEALGFYCFTRVEFVIFIFLVSLVSVIVTRCFK